MNTDKEIEKKSNVYYDRMFEEKPILRNFSVDYEDGLRQGFINGFKAAMFTGPFDIFPQDEGTDFFPCPKQNWNALIKQRDDAIEALEAMKKQAPPLAQP